jgi:hypothetical protein
VCCCEWEQRVEPVYDAKEVDGEDFLEVGRVAPGSFGGCAGV